jgi:glycosyltransferase involved in cell wall biosynthesis
MSAPRLTVIVPTINRPDTLYWTLKTVLDQQYSNYTVIVSDNFSNDNTPEVVASFKSDKITYINPGRRLSMARHWEFILEHVHDGYVTILGDDDGMLSGGLEKVAAIISKHNVQAVGWRFGNFNWAGIAPFFMIPMANYYRVIDAPSEIQKIFKKNIINTIEFPNLYGGFISVELINKIKQKHGGYFFHSLVPDFFSGGMIAASVQQYIRLEFPITINATSKHSTGYAVVNKAHPQKAFDDVLKDDNNIPFHPKLIFLRSLTIPIAEAMLQVAELEPAFPAVDIKKIIREALDEAISMADSNETLNEFKAGLLKMAEMNGLADYTEALLKQAVYVSKVKGIKKKFSPVSIALYVDTTNTGIDTVKDACDFTDAVIPSGYSRLWIGWFKNYFRFTALCKYLYLKYFSDKKKYL